MDSVLKILMAKAMRAKRMTAPQIGTAIVAALNHTSGLAYPLDSWLMMVSTCLSFSTDNCSGNQSAHVIIVD